jgi:hypothetical protein
MGFRFFGKRDLRPDGSYVTTKFFCLLYLPVIPISTMRIIPVGSKTWLPFGKTRYKLIGKQPLHWLQILSVYLVAFLFVLYGVLFFRVVDPYLEVRFGSPLADFTKFLFFLAWMSLAGIAWLWFRSRTHRPAENGIRELDRPTPIE